MEIKPSNPQPSADPEAEIAAIDPVEAEVQHRAHAGGRVKPKIREKMERIINAVRMGAFVETAGAYAGVSRMTLRKWLEAGASNKSPLYRWFWLKCEQALAHAELRHLFNIQSHAKTQWTASAWCLERMYPDRYGRYERVDLRTAMMRQQEEEARDKDVHVVKFTVDDGSGVLVSERIRQRLGPGRPAPEVVDIGDGNGHRGNGHTDTP